MGQGSRTGFDWAYRFRSYAKKLVSKTTSISYIVWLEDAETVIYNDTSFSKEPLYENLSSPKSIRPRKGSEACSFSIPRTVGKTSYQASSFAVFRTTTVVVGNAGTFSRIHRIRTNSKMTAADGCLTGRWRMSG